MHLRCSKGSFYGEHPLMRPKAVELHMQNSKVGLPFKGRESMKTAGVGGGVLPHQLGLWLLHLCW